MHNCDYDPKTQTYVYRPTGEMVPAECIDEFAQKKLEEAVARLTDAVLTAQTIRRTARSCIDKLDKLWQDGVPAKWSELD